MSRTPSTVPSKPYFGRTTDCTVRAKSISTSLPGIAFFRSDWYFAWKSACWKPWRSSSSSRVMTTGVVFRSVPNLGHLPHSWPSGAGCRAAAASANSPGSAERLASSSHWKSFVTISSLVAARKPNNLPRAVKASFSRESICLRMKKPLLLRLLGSSVSHSSSSEQMPTLSFRL